MVILTAHSGSDQTKDNSLEFVDTFISAACDAIEVDVRKTEKNILYLSHDWIPNAEKAVRLEEVFQRVKQTSMKVNCDLKEANLERLVFQLAEKYQMKNQVLLSGTVSLVNLSGKEKEKHLFYNLEQFIPGLYEQSYPIISEEKLSEIISFCKQNAVTIINVHKGFSEPAMIKVLLKEGIRLSVWTVNDIKKIKELFELGVYNVTSKQVLQYRRKYGKEWNNEIPKS